MDRGIEPGRGECFLGPEEDGKYLLPSSITHNNPTQLPKTPKISSTPKTPDTIQLADAGSLKATSGPSKEPGNENLKSKEKEANKDKALEHSKPPLAAKEASKEKEAAKDKALEPSSQSATKADPPPPANR